MTPGIRLKQVTVGVAPTRRDIFSREEAQRQKRLVEARLRDWGIRFVNIDFLNVEGLLYDAADVPRIADQWRREGVDAVFVPHCNFGTESAAAGLGKAMGLPYLLWGPRDEAPLADGMRDRDTQCGLFATSKVLRRLGVPFTYVVNSRVDAPVFERGVRGFVAAAAVVREFRRLRIGQVSPRPQAFWTVMANEGELLERFGIEVVTTTLVDVATAVKRKLAEGKAVRAEAASLKAKADCSRLKDDEVARVAALKLALLDWVEAEGLSSVALQCWTALQETLDMAPCFVHGELTELGVPVACETDIHGAVTSVMLQAAAQGTTPTFFADLTIRHPEHENRELLWHCGPFPLALKAEDEPATVGPHYMMPRPMPAVGEWRLRGGDVTLGRFDGDRGEYRLLLGHARGADGPRTRGTYLWVEVGDWPKWEEALIRGPYIHHIVGVHGKLAPVLYEACRYIPGLEPECVEPTEEDILAHWRGADM